MGDAMTIECKDYNHESQYLTIGLDTGGSVLCNMADELFGYYGNNCDIELWFHSDDLKDLCFKIGGNFYTALQIVQWCEANHDAIRREVEESSDNTPPYLQSEFI